MKSSKDNTTLFNLLRQDDISKILQTRYENLNWVIKQVLEEPLEIGHYTYAHKILDEIEFLNNYLLK